MYFNANAMISISDQNAATSVNIHKASAESANVLSEAYTRLGESLNIKIDKLIEEQTKLGLQRNVPPYIEVT